MIIKSHDKKNPEGAVLLFALIVMLLMGLMSAAIFLNTRTELAVSHNTNLGRDAFTKADAAGRVAVQLARVLINSGIGQPVDYIIENPNGPFEVIINDNTLTQPFVGEGEGGIISLSYQNVESEFAERQLAAMAEEKPHVIIKHNGEIVATAAVSIGYLSSAAEGQTTAGTSADGSGIQGGNAPTRQAAIMVVATGRALVDKNSAEAFFNGSADAPYSVISTIYKDTVR